MVPALRMDHRIYVNNCFALDETGKVSFLRLSAQVFLELSDFERLGKLVLHYLSSRGLALDARALEVSVFSGP